MSGYSLHSGQWGEAKVTEDDPVKRFWADMGQKMISRSDILGKDEKDWQAGKAGVPYFLKRNYKNQLTEEQTQKILAEAQHIKNTGKYMNGSKYPYKGGARRTSKKTRRQTKKHRKTQRRHR
jgi:hypothetical protein